MKGAFPRHGTGLWTPLRIRRRVFAHLPDPGRSSDATSSVTIRRYRPIDPDRSFEMGGASASGAPGEAADHLQWESVKERMIRAGTVRKLVDCVIGADDLMDTRHFNVFFATYRAFATPQQVLDMLLQRYESLEQDVTGSTSALVTQNSIRSVLVCWLDMYPEDFYDDTDCPLLQLLLEFGQKYRLTDVRAKARKLRERFRHLSQDGGPIMALPSVEHLVVALGYSAAEYASNARERAKMFDVGRENCVQIAEQLTFWDAALFKELLTHQCQGSVWSRRHKISSDKVYTVKATIDQFNAVSQRVMTSIVLPDCRADFRAKIIAKWIDIARELRALKNFSSLKAVLSALQSEPVHRLRSAWGLVPSRSLAQFRDLSSIYDMDEDGDEHNARRILDQEGTAKSSPLRRPQLVSNCRRTKSDVNLAECQGTVPYLGSFLTDLTMIDQATSDLTEDGLINFEKRRREFEVLAKLRLFQSAARAYHIPMDAAFCAWFHYLPCMDEKMCFDRSVEIERAANGHTPEPSKSSGKSNTLSRLFNSSRGESPSRTLQGQSSRDSGCAVDGEQEVNGNQHNTSSSSLPRAPHTAPSTPASSVSWKGGRNQLQVGCEFSPQSLFPGGSGAQHARTASADSHDPRRGHAQSASSSSSSSAASNAPPATSFHLARVGLDDELQTEPSGANYKCIKVENGDRMASLIERVLEKHMLEGDRNDFCLVQLLPNGSEFPLPDKCNPFYAMAPDPTSPMLNLILRRRGSEEEDGKASTHLGPSAKKLNKMKRSNLLRWSSGYL